MGGGQKRKKSGGGAYAGSGPKLHRPKIRAHRNPLADGEYDFPATPTEKNWSIHYPSLIHEDSNMEVTVADVGCGFGGLLENLSPILPNELILGMEIRPPVVRAVEERITALRKEGKGQNISVVLSNVMKHCANFFRKGQLSRMFFCFPDPHFKKSNFRRRIISHALLDVYAYVLRPGGIVYTITDVEDLHQWMSQHLEQHPLFERIHVSSGAATAASTAGTAASVSEQKKEAPVEERKQRSVCDDSGYDHEPILQAMRTTDEGQKVSRFKGSMYITVHRRVLPGTHVAAASVSH